MLKFVGDVPYADKIQAVYDDLPARFKKKDVSVEILPDSEWPDGNNFTAYYESGKIVMRGLPVGIRGTLFNWSRVGKFLRTFTHEMGHHLHLAILTDNERKGWLELWRKEREHLPTSYARVNEREGFGECVECEYGRRLVFFLFRPFFPRLNERLDSVIRAFCE